MEEFIEIVNFISFWGTALSLLAATILESKNMKKMDDENHDRGDDYSVIPFLYVSIIFFAANTLCRFLS